MVSEQAAAGADVASFHWWFWPCLLGLDAPCVALTWTYGVGRATDRPLVPRVALALFLTVWSIYLGDRLLDVARCQNWQTATGRLRFGRRWWPMFAVLLGCSLMSLLAVLWNGLPAAVLRRGAIVAIGVGLHYLLFVTPVVLRVDLPGKEVGVGLFFPLGAFVCVGATLKTLPLFVALVLVVTFNCLVIAARDTESDRANDPRAASRWWPTLRRDLGWLGLALTVAAGAMSVVAHETAFYLAVAVASGALTTLHWRAQRASGDAVRALADFALLTPLVVLGVESLTRG